MAGVKGKSGGPRKNAGGARPGAGRKPKSANTPPPPPPTETEQPQVDPSKLDNLEWLEAVRKGLIDAKPIQVRAAIAAVQYTHTKRGDGGKKDEAAEKAKKAASKFATVAPPLKLVRGK